MNNLIFVYGTLKQNKYNHSHMYGQYIGKAQTNTDFTLYVAGLPYLVEEKGSGVKGELYKVDNVGLKKLDYFEGHPHFYKRKLINIICNGESQKAWAYIYPEKPLKIDYITNEY